VRTRLPIVAAADLAGGSALFALAIGVTGVNRSMVIVGSMPLIAQAIIWASGSERPSAFEVAGAVLVTLAVAWPLCESIEVKVLVDPKGTTDSEEHDRVIRERGLTGARCWHAWWR